MPRTILVGLDGSPDSSPIALGIAWARRFNALLVGIGVVNEPALRGPHDAPPGGYLEKLQEEWVGAARKEVEQRLADRLLAALRKQFGGHRFHVAD